MNVDLSIVIVSYNTKKLLLSCIDSIIKFTKKVEYEIIVVDNASLDGSIDAVENLKLKMKNLKLIRNKKNVGFAAANNQGWKDATGEFVLFLNSDTEVRDGVISNMASWMEKNSSAGVATCALKRKDGSLQSTGGYFPTIYRVFAWMLFLDDLPFLGKLIKSFHPHTPDFFGNNQDYLRKHQQDWVTGAFLLTRRDIVEKVGGWDEIYFMYVEEVDLCFRIKKAGWEVWYLPQWSIIHMGGASGTKELSVISEFTGLKRFYKKFYPSWQYPVLRLLLKVGALGRALLFGILEGRQNSRIYAKAFRAI